MVQQSSPPWSESQNTITFQQTSTLYKYHTRDHIDYYREHFFFFFFHTNGINSDFSLF